MSDRMLVATRKGLVSGQGNGACRLRATAFPGLPSPRRSRTHATVRSMLRSARQCSHEAASLDDGGRRSRNRIAAVPGRRQRRACVQSGLGSGGAPSSRHLWMGAPPAGLFRSTIAARAGPDPMRCGTRRTATTGWVGATMMPASTRFRPTRATVSVLVWRCPRRRLGYARRWRELAVRRQGPDCDVHAAGSARRSDDPGPASAGAVRRRGLTRVGPASLRGVPLVDGGAALHAAQAAGRCFRLRGCGASARSGHGVVRPGGQGRMPRAGRRRLGALGRAMAASFGACATGLPQADAYDLVYRHGLEVDDSGAGSRWARPPARSG